MTVSTIDDRQRAARTVLRRPLVRSSDETEYRLVKRYAAELRDWFEINTGWSLHVDSEVVRLLREPATVDDAAHPILARSGATPFSRRRYVLLMLCLAVLERSDAQIALGRLAEQVVLAAAGPELSRARGGFRFGLESHEERSDLVAAVQVLLGWGVLDRVAGDEQDFVHRDGDALYDVSRRVLSQLVVTRRGPSTVSSESLDEQLEELRDRGIPPSEELRNMQLRHRLTRRLLDDPVLYLDDLDEEESAYLRSQRSAICRRITELTGLVAEVRAEGLAMVDLDDDLTDLRMPEMGTDGHATLLLAEYLARSGEPEHPLDDLRAHIRTVAPDYRTYWRADTREPGAEVGLVDLAIDRLSALRLVERTGDGVRVLPALARFAIAEPTILGSRT